MKLGKHIYSALLVTLVILLTQLLACGSGSENASGYHTYWFTDPPEVFHTNDIERAKEEIPFNLILPTYLPDNIKPYPYMIEGPIEGACLEEEVEIRVTYFPEEVSDYSIYIVELNRPITMLPTPDSRATYLDIVGFQVLKQVTLGSVISSSGKRYIPGLNYSWNQDSVHFDMIVDGYDRDEARKIVKSMIEQAE
jgi:hypothetical protein